MARFSGIRICKRCCQEYSAISGSQKYCAECAKIVKKEIKQRYKKKRKELEAARRPKSAPSKTINEIVREVMAYNKKHGTHLTYGKYVEKMTLGLLKD